MQKKPTTKTKANGTSASIATNGSTEKTFPSRDEIARRAYELFVARGRTGGRDLDDWVQAERELAEKAHQHN
ncbi:MAG: hypothetical protein JWR26_3242 [Pedosphaera sp.]|nr:hypothetical protein [Pedosphaera sp.]